MAQVSKRRHRWMTWCLCSLLLALLCSWVVIDNKTRQAAKQHRLDALENLNSGRFIIVPPQESPFRLLADYDAQHLQ